MKLATEETFLAGYARRRSADQYDTELIAFRVAGEQYAVEIGQMREIVKLAPITEVPRVPAFVRGVMSVRGQVIPVIDLRARLGLPPGEATRSSRMLVCTFRDEPHGLLVDSVASVVRLRHDQIEAAPTIGGGVEMAFLRGIGRTDGQMIILLDLAAVLTFSVEARR